MFAVSPWANNTPVEVIQALEDSARPNLSISGLQALCSTISDVIKHDREVKFKIVCNRVIANDQEGVQWLLAVPQRFPACYTDTLQNGNAIDVAARAGHLDLLCWLATSEDAKYWSEVEQQWVQCVASPQTLYAAVEGGNLDVVQELAVWFAHQEEAVYDECVDTVNSKEQKQRNKELKELFKRDTSLILKVVSSICTAYPPNDKQQQGQAWHLGKHFKLLQWLMQQGVAWDVQTMGAAAKAGHLELINWLADNSAPYGDPRVCIEAIQNPDQDQAIKTLKLLLSLTPPAPWKPKTRGFAKVNGSSRGEERPGLCEAAAAAGKFKVLKWLATAADGLLPLCEGKFEQRQVNRQRDSADTKISLTPWEDGNEPGRVWLVAVEALKNLTWADEAAGVKWPADRMADIGDAAGYLNSAAAAEEDGDPAAAARYRTLAAQTQAQVQEYRDIIAWLESDNSGYKQHVAEAEVLLQQTRLEMGIKQPAGSAAKKRKLQQLLGVEFGSCGVSESRGSGTGEAAAVSDSAVEAE